MVLKIAYNCYAYFFGRRCFRKLNKLLYHLSLRGLGVLNYQNDYLNGEKFWLNSYLNNKSNPVVIDIGANVGNYSKHALEANKKANIFALEPHPLTFKKLQNNLVGKSFKLYNLGAGVKKDTLELYDYDSNDGSSHASLYKDVIEDIHGGHAICHQVDIIKLDDFLSEHNIHIVDLLKIDTEGNELNVLKGAEVFLKSNKVNAIHFEFNEMNVISKTTFKDFWDILPNYQFFRVLPGGELLRIERYSPIDCEIYAFQNIIAILNEN